MAMTITQAKDKLVSLKHLSHDLGYDINHIALLIDEKNYSQACTALDTLAYYEEDEDLIEAIADLYALLSQGGF